MVSALLFLLAVVCSVIAALLGFAVFSGSAHVFGWAFLGIAFGWAGLLVAHLPARP